jgi:hypothetical protein
MNSNQRGAVATSAASSGVAGAAVVILTWGLGLLHVQVPAEVAAALLVVLSPALHVAVVKLGIESVRADAGQQT